MRPAALLPASLIAAALALPLASVAHADIVINIDKNAQQMRAYRELPAEELFDVQWVRVRLGPEDMPGYKAPRVACAECGEGINFKREVVRDERVLCKSCAGERYYEPL